MIQPYAYAWYNLQTLTLVDYRCDAPTTILNNYYLIKRYGINFFFHKIIL